ncbi:MAG: hypothetical protein HDS41_01435 [Bacteroides sp.]|nr:hypothetical protein [Bacteroides sp.]
MKKILFLLVAVCAGVAYNYAEPAATTSESESSSYSQATAQIYYDGSAYSSAQDGMIPHADGSVSVYWTSDGCSVNGNSGYTVGTIDGNFAMYINGKVKSMTRYVSYKGERYYFQY